MDSQGGVSSQQDGNPTTVTKAQPPAKTLQNVPVPHIKIEEPPAITVTQPDGPSKPVEDIRGPLPPITNGVAQPPAPIVAVPLGDAPLPGALPDKPAEVIPDWYKAGWRAVGGIDDPAPTQDQADKIALETFLSDMYYGQWYHHAGVIIFAVFTTHVMTLLRMGWGWIFILLAVCSTYYSHSAAMFRRNARNDIQRELVKKKLATEHESADWMNNFLDRFWLIYEPVLSKSIAQSVDQVLSQSTPAFLDSLRLSDFTLGSTAPRIDQVRTFPTTADEVIEMDWSLKFTPTDRSDITPRQALRKVNPKITLEVKVGKGPATAALPILLEDLCFEGHMRIRLKLMSTFPHIQLVELSFLEKPIFDYVLKPLGGDTFGFDVGNIPGLSSFIRDMVHSILGPMMYQPHYFTLNLEQLLSGKPVDTAVGVLQVHVVAARSLKGVKIGGGTPDPYVSLSISNRAELARTPWRPSTTNPHWGTTHYILLTAGNMSEELSLTVYDYNEHRKDAELGAAIFDLHSLTENATQEHITKDVFNQGKERGQLEFDVSYFPVIVPAVVDGKPEPLPDSNVGICRLTIHQAKELDKTRSMSGDLNPLAKVFVGNSKKPQLTTPTYKHTLNPVWESSTEYLVSNKKRSAISVKVIDDRDFLKDPIVGTLSMPLGKLLEATTKTGLETWFPLSKAKTGKLRITAEWKPLNMAGNLQGAGSYTPPIGIVRIWIKNAKDVKNVEANLGGKSDPYVRVMLQGVVKARTDVINNNLNPEWDQIIYVPVHALRETLVLELMDYQHLTKDRPLGSVDLTVADLASENSNDHEYPYQGTGRKAFSSPIRIDKTVSKGTLVYEAEFLPSLHLEGLEFDETNEVEQALGGSDEAATVSEAQSTSRTSSDAEYEKVSHSETDGEGEQRTHKKGALSTDTTATAATTSTVTENKGVHRTREELLQCPSGILVFHVKTGQLAKKGRLEILLDDCYWPSFATEKAISTSAKWESVGEGFVKEMDFGRVWIRLNEHDDGEKETIFGEYKSDTKAFLETCLMRDEEVTLTNSDGQFAGRVTMSAKFVPVPIKLEPRESILNMGTLRVDLVDGHDLHGVDRSGKSDPFVVFTLGGQKVFKSQTIKKTLTPVWNENFAVQVPSRVTAAFSLEVFDWNQFEGAKSLGEGFIDLAAVDPFTAREVTVPLTSTVAGSKGSIRIRLLFQPELIVKTRKNTSTFSTAGRAVTQVGHAPIGAAKGVAHGVGNVGKLGKGLFIRDKSKGGLGTDDTNELTTPAFDPPPAQVSAPAPLSTPSDTVKSKALPATMPVSANTALPPGESPSSVPEDGSIKVTVIGAKDLSLMGESSIKPYVLLKCGKDRFETRHSGKTVTPQWNEAFTVHVGPETKEIHATIFDHKSFGKDKTLGEADIDVWRHLRPNDANPLSAADVWVELRQGTGQLNVRLEYEKGAQARSTASMVSSEGRSRLPNSPSRFSISRKSGATGVDD